jgi:hypothetical protein
MCTLIVLLLPFTATAAEGTLVHALFQLFALLPYCRKHGFAQSSCSLLSYTSQQLLYSLYGLCSFIFIRARMRVGESVRAKLLASTVAQAALPGIV